MFHPFFCFLLFLPTLLQAQETLSPEKLISLLRVQEPVVSPSGEWVVYGVDKVSLSDNKGNKDLYIISSKGGEPKQLTDSKSNEFNPRWINGGKQIAYQSTESGAPQIWMMNVDGTDKKQLTKIESGVSNYLFSANMKTLVYLSEVKLAKAASEIYPDLPKTSARIIDDLFYRHWSDWDDYSYDHVFIVPFSGTTNGEGSHDITPGEMFDIEHYSLSPDAKTIAYTSKKLSGKAFAESTNSDIYLYDIATEKTKNLSEGMPGYDRYASFSPDGTKLCWESMATAGFESDKSRLIVYDLVSGQKTDLTMHFPEGVQNVVWSADNKHIYFISATAGTQQLFDADLTKKTINQLTFSQCNYQTLATAGNSLIANRMSMSAPTDIYKVDLKSKTETPLTFTNKEKLSGITMGKVEKRMIKTSDGKDMLVWVIYPPGFDPVKRYPALLYCQGGPQSAVSQFFSYRWNFQLMAAQGYIVVAPNRRGLPGFGQEWNDQISGDWGGQAIQDYLSAIDDVSNEPYVDKNKLGAVGASYGGYSVYMLAGKHQKRFKTFISHCGLFNLESWYGTTEEMFFANQDIKGAYWDKPQPKSYEQFSPHKFVGEWDTPMLVIHGEKDFRVPLGEGMQAFQAAQLKGIPSRFLYFPDEGHWVNKPQNSVVWYRVFFDWLGRSLK